MILVKRDNITITISLVPPFFSFLQSLNDPLFVPTFSHKFINIQPPLPLPLSTAAFQKWEDLLLLHRLLIWRKGYMLTILILNSLNRKEQWLGYPSEESGHKYRTVHSVRLISWWLFFGNRSGALRYCITPKPHFHLDEKKGQISRTVSLYQVKHPMLLTVQYITISGDSLWTWTSSRRNRGTTFWVYE